MLEVCDWIITQVVMLNQAKAKRTAPEAARLTRCQDLTRIIVISWLMLRDNVGVCVSRGEKSFIVDIFVDVTPSIRNRKLSLGPF